MDPIDMTKMKEALDKRNQMSEEDINSVADEFGRIASENEDIEHLRDLQHMGEDPVKGLVAAEESYTIGPDGKPIFNIPTQDLNESDKDIFEVAEESGTDFESESFKNLFNKNVTENYGMSDEDAAQVLDAILTYRKDKKTNVYAMMPDSVKLQIQQMCAQNNIPLENRGTVAREIAEHFIAEAAQDQTFVDFEAALNKAMQIPSVADLYNEHLNDTMDRKLPAMADAIEAEDPAKAAMLREIARKFEYSMSYTALVSEYETNTRIRKLVRRDFDKVADFAADVNYLNRDNKFKMPDAITLRSILNRQIVGTDPRYTSEDVDKFLTLAFNSIIYYTDNRDAVVWNAYVYYLLKNIAMISYSGNARNSFSAELINNIKILMLYIRARESEFNDANPVNAHKQKRSQRKANRR